MIHWRKNLSMIWMSFIYHLEQQASIWSAKYIDMQSVNAWRMDLCYLDTEHCDCYFVNVSQLVYVDISPKLCRPVSEKLLCHDRAWISKPIPTVGRASPSNRPAKFSINLAMKSVIKSMICAGDEMHLRCIGKCNAGYTALKMWAALNLNTGCGSSVYLSFSSQIVWQWFKVWQISRTQINTPTLCFLI